MRTWREIGVGLPLWERVEGPGPVHRSMCEEARREEKSEIKCFISYLSVSDGWDIHNFYSILQKCSTSLCGNIHIFDFWSSLVSFTRKVIWGQVKCNSCEGTHCDFRGKEITNTLLMMALFTIGAVWVSGHFNMLTVGTWFRTANPPIAGQTNIFQFPVKSPVACFCFGKFSNSKLLQLCFSNWPTKIGRTLEPPYEAHAV